jgi:hypothetical protein
VTSQVLAPGLPQEAGRAGDNDAHETNSDTLHNRSCRPGASAALEF